MEIQTKNRGRKRMAELKDKKDVKEINQEMKELKEHISEAKEVIKEIKKEVMVPWVRGIFTFTEQSGEVFSFIYNGNRLALKDQESAEIPLEIANHLNSLKYDIMEWTRPNKDTHEGQQGVKTIRTTRKRCTFTIFDHFEMPKGTRVGLKPNERATA